MFVFGVLSSRVHGAWARRAGGSNGIGNDSRWNSRSTFLPFPFPDASPAQRASIGEVAGQLDRARRAVLAACPGTSLTGLYNDIEAGRRGAAGAGTGVAAVASLHAELDRAVLAAYGFPQEIEVEALLVRLLALNHERAAGEARGELVRPVWPHER